MNLENILYRTNKFVDLEPIVEDAKEGISFFGIRYAYIAGEKETFSIHILAKRVLELMKQNRFEYTDDEREAGKRIAAKINQIYENNDKRLETKWCITRIFCYIMDQINSYSPRFDWEDESRNFEYYTEKQYETTFGYKPDKDHYASITHYFDIGRVALYPTPYRDRNGARNLAT